MIFHYNQGVPAWMGFIQRIGWSGVDLFFVLSGYLIGFQLLQEVKTKNNISLSKFYVKRFFRIIPAYLFVLILYYSLQNFREGTGMPPLWKFLTFTQNIGLDVQHGKSFSHAWSLCIEEQFYFLLPLTILFLFLNKFHNKSVYIIIGLILFGFIIRLFNWYTYVQPVIDNGNLMLINFLEKVYYPSYNRMDGLLIGLGIAAIFVFEPNFTDKITPFGNYFLIAGFGLIILAYYVCNNFISFNTAIYGFPLVSVAYGLIVIAAISPSCILYKFKSKITFLIATLSYVIYLTHKQIYHLVKMGFANNGINSDDTIVFWTCIVVALLFGLFTHLIIEKPFYIIRDKVLIKLDSISIVGFRKLVFNTIIVNSMSIIKKARP